MKKLLDIMAALRDPQTGCPWDIKQTFETIVPYTLEEAYEVADAIENGDMGELKSELGDLLFQVVFYAQMAKEQGEFDFNDVVNAVSDKLVRRHPHVFSPQHYRDEDELNQTRANEEKLNQAWEESKARERDKQNAGEGSSILAGVARALPALKRSQKLQQRAARVGFDWPDIKPVFDKLEEELEEIKDAIQRQDPTHIREEVGDLIFASVNLARHLEVDAEEALRQGNEKFERRFGYIEGHLQKQNKSIKDCKLDELEALWQASKKSE